MLAGDRWVIGEIRESCRFKELALIKMELSDVYLQLNCRALLQSSWYYVTLGRYEAPNLTVYQNPRPRNNHKGLSPAQ